MRRGGCVPKNQELPLAEGSDVGAWRTPQGADAAVHDALTNFPGSFELAKSAVANAARFRGELLLELDVLISKPAAASLAELVEVFHGLGARRFNLWMLASEGRARKHGVELLPRLPEAAESVRRALAMAARLGVDAVVRSYYIPYCFLPDHPETVWHPLEENALVVTPTSTFRLEKGSLDLGKKTPACRGCLYEDKCFGVHPTYLSIYGDGEIKPVGK